jgi:hypothetical protein
MDNDNKIEQSLEFCISNDDNDKKNNNVVDNLIENIEQFFTNLFFKDYFEIMKKNK